MPRALLPSESDVEQRCRSFELRLAATMNPLVCSTDTLSAVSEEKNQQIFCWRNFTNLAKFCTTSGAAHASISPEELQTALPSRASIYLLTVSSMDPLLRSRPPFFPELLVPLALPALKRSHPVQNFLRFPNDVTQNIINGKVDA